MHAEERAKGLPGLRELPTLRGCKTGSLQQAWASVDSTEIPGSSVGQALFQGRLITRPRHGHAVCQL
eukprot:1156535-Pelagomonas_calceolata.AAC.5